MLGLPPPRGTAEQPGCRQRCADRGRLSLPLFPGFLSERRQRPWGPELAGLRGACQQVGCRGEPWEALPVYFPSSPAKPQEFGAWRRPGGLRSPGILSDPASPRCETERGQRGDNLSPRKRPLRALGRPTAGGFMFLCVFWRVLPIVRAELWIALGHQRSPGGIAAALLALGQLLPRVSSDQRADSSPARAQRLLPGSAFCCRLFFLFQWHRGLLLASHSRSVPAHRTGAEALTGCHHHRLPPGSRRAPTPGCDTGLVPSWDPGAGGGRA